MIDWLLSWLLAIPGLIWFQVVAWARRNPTTALLAALAFIRSFGTTIQTGSAGVLFSFGRAKRVLEPGFHPLLPIFQKVRVTPIRSITLDLPPQRVTTADGLVFDVHANIVYRVEDPIKALTAIDDIRKGILTLVPLLLHTLMREHDAMSLATPRALGADLTARAREALARWGIGVEQAGLATIAPTRPTIRLMQLGPRVRERAALVTREFLGDVPIAVALALIAAGPAPKGRSHARYHRRRHLPPPPHVPTEADSIPREVVRRDPSSQPGPAN